MSTTRGTIEIPGSRSPESRKAVASFAKKAFHYGIKTVQYTAL